MGFVGGRGGGGRKAKPSKVGSKVRRANKKAAEQGPRDAEMLVPGGGKVGAEGVDLETVDWDKVGGWSKVKYDPNRLIFGAQEEGFVELEEIDMNDLDLSKLVPAPSKGKGASRGGKDGAKSIGGFETVDLADFDDHDGDFGEDDPAHFASDSEGDATPSREKKASSKKQKTADAETHQTKQTKPKNVSPKPDEASPGTGSNLSAKEARIEKRKARWKAKVEAAKAKKAAARLEAGKTTSQDGTPSSAREEEVPSPRDTSRADDEKRDASAVEAITAAATGSAKDAGWHMDYNNYPTSGFGAVVDGVDLDAGADVSNWLEFDLHPKLLRALQDMGFTDPTPIQREVLNPAIKGRCDVIGAAETGSGKTLAFGLPILHRLLTQMDAEAEDSDSESGSDSDAKEGGDEEGDGTNADDGERQKGGSDSESDPFANIVDETGRSGAGAGFRLPKRRKALRALIVAPTRELAMQVCDMLKAVAKYAPEVGITPVVGGMSLQKQERLLRRRPEIVVATPGRLWELMHQQGHEHFLDLGRLNFLVLDEADRMVERGHFAELHNIIDILPMPPRVKRPPGAAKATPETLKVFKKRGPASAPANAGKRGGKGMKGGNAPVVDGDIVEGFVGKKDANGDGDGEPDGVEISLRPSQMLDRQTFVFSATLTVPDSVRRKLKRGRHVGDGKPGGDKKEKGDKATQTLSGLMEAVPFYGRVKLVDLTDQSRTVAERVTESALECTEDERDALLYHILTQQPGLVIVFVNAISALRRLLSLLKILQLPVEGLHGNMQQRARLKYLDRFRAAALSEGTDEGSFPVSGTDKATGGVKKRTSVLVATDVAARGIDIKGIDLVVHYQVPTSADTYVHRSGRTGRARNEGASVLLVTPGERTRYRALLRALKRDNAPLPAFPTVETAVAEARRRLSLAKRLDKIAHARQRDAADAEWRRANAAELGIELDSDEDADADAVLVFNAADKKAKSKMAQKAHRAFERAKRREARRAEGADDGAGGDESESESDSEDFADARMAELVDAGFDQDDQASAVRLGAHRRLGREEAKLRNDLAELLKTPLGVKAERRAGVASARYPSRGEGAARMAANAREKTFVGAGGVAFGQDGTKAASAVDMLKGGAKAAARVGAAPGGAAGKKRKRAKGAPGEAR